MANDDLTVMDLPELAAELNRCLELEQEEEATSIAAHARSLDYVRRGGQTLLIIKAKVAKSTAVIVPGTSSSVKGGWLHDGHDDALGDPRWIDTRSPPPYVGGFARRSRFPTHCSDSGKSVYGGASKNTHVFPGGVSDRACVACQTLPTAASAD
jgi:hypothetical protein